MAFYSLEAPHFVEMRFGYITVSLLCELPIAQQQYRLIPGQDVRQRVPTTTYLYPATKVKISVSISIYTLIQHFCIYIQPNISSAHIMCAALPLWKNVRGFLLLITFPRQIIGTFGLR
jgi:hypothetical protein